MDKNSSIIFLAICHFLALAIFSFIIFRLTYLFFRKKNTNREEKILASAITLLFFSKTFHIAILYPIQVLVSNLQKLFYTTYSYSKDFTGPTENENFSLNVSVQQILDVFPLSKLLIAFSFFILIYLIIKYIKENLGEKKAPQIASISNPSILIYNSIISAVLIFSLFLVISVCITIPYLNQISKPTTFTLERLESTLNEYSSKDSSLKISIVKELPLLNSDIKALVLNDSIASKKFNNLNPSHKEILNNAISRFEDNYNQIIPDRNNLINDLINTSKEYKSKENKYKRDLLVNYEKEIQSITVDKANLFQSSTQNFTYFIQDSKEDFYNTLQDINRSDIYNTSLKTRFVDQIRTIITQLSENIQGDTSTYLFGNLYQLTANFLPYRSFIIQGRANNYLPSFKRTGQEWGIFGRIAGYLIKPQSPELVLLMGMFGFGLLGASLLSFQSSSINENFIKAFKNQLLIPNFGVVLARGFGAALVIYLATKGGLAIFSAGTSTDANGYILLLTCFVGAVYSEKVWTKIRISLYGSDSVKKDEVSIKDQKLEEPKTEEKKVEQ